MNEVKLLLFNVFFFNCCTYLAGQCFAAEFTVSVDTTRI